MALFKIGPSSQDVASLGTKLSYQDFFQQNFQSLTAGFKDNGYQMDNEIYSRLFDIT